MPECDWSSTKKAVNRERPWDDPETGLVIKNFKAVIIDMHGSL